MVKIYKCNKCGKVIEVEITGLHASPKCDKCDTTMTFVSVKYG